MLRRIAEPFAWGPTERTRELGEQIFAFLPPVSEDSRSAEIHESVQFEYLAGSVIERTKVTLFAYIWFDSLNAAKEYLTKRGMTIVGGWNE